MRLCGATRWQLGIPKAPTATLPCPLLQLTRFLDTFSSFIQDRRFLRARSTSA